MINKVNIDSSHRRETSLRNVARYQCFVTAVNIAYFQIYNLFAEQENQILSRSLNNAQQRKLSSQNSRHLFISNTRMVLKRNDF